MKFANLLVLGAMLFACQPITLPTVTIIDNDKRSTPRSGSVDKIFTLHTNERVPSTLLNQAGVALNSSDRILLNGLPIEPTQPITNSSITLQIRRAVTLTVKTPEKEQKFETSAFTIGEALQEASVWLHAGDRVSSPLNSPISQTPIVILPIRAFTVTVDGKSFQFQSSAQTVGEALAGAGIPLIGLDYSIPAENEPPPSNGQIRVVRVSESVLLAQKSIPFESDFQGSANIPLDQTQIVQPGEPGLTVQRIRIRYEDGKEISRLTEAETTVRAPKTRIMGYGTKIEIKKATVDGVNIEYWRAIQMYATSYSPCRSGGDVCHSGTASGKSLRKGMVALRYSWYLSMRGQQFYIPGYGFGSVEDICGGCVGKPWIDLGFSDSNFEGWHSWVTVYFLTPVPANVIYVLQ